MRAALLLLIVVTLITTGCYTIDTADFGGQSSIQFASGLKSDIWLKPKETGYGVPLVYWYDRWSGPYDLRVQIWDAEMKYESIEIREVVMEYTDGRVEKREVAWNRRLTPYTQHNSSSEGIIKTEMLHVSDDIAGVVDQHADVKITLRGELTKQNGQKVPFETSESFEAKSSIRTISYAEHWAGC